MSRFGMPLISYARMATSGRMSQITALRIPFMSAVWQIAPVIMRPGSHPADLDRVAGRVAFHELRCNHGCASCMAACGVIVTEPVLGAFTFSLLILISFYFNTSQEETCGTDF